MIKITKKLTVSPDKGSLPLEITLTQSLTTDSPPEQADVVYQLTAPSGNIGFDTPGNKTLTPPPRQVAKNTPPFVDTTTLVGAAGNIAFLDIEQTLTYRQGSK